MSKNKIKIKIWEKRLSIQVLSMDPRFRGGRFRASNGLHIRSFRNPAIYLDQEDIFLLGTQTNPQQKESLPIEFESYYARDVFKDRLIAALREWNTWLSQDTPEEVTCLNCFKWESCSIRTPANSLTGASICDRFVPFNSLRKVGPRIDEDNSF